MVDAITISGMPAARINATMRERIEGSHRRIAAPTLIISIEGSTFSLFPILLDQPQQIFRDRLACDVIIDLMQPALQP